MAPGTSSPALARCDNLTSSGSLAHSSGHGSPGRLGPRARLVTDRRPTGQPGPLPGLTGSARGLPAELCPGPGRGPAAGPAQPSAGLHYTARLQLFRMRGGGPEGAGPRLGLRSQEPAGKPGSSRTGGWEPYGPDSCTSGKRLCASVFECVYIFKYVHLCGVRDAYICVNICNLWVFRRVWTLPMSFIPPEAPKEAVPPGSFYSVPSLGL